MPPELMVGKHNFSSVIRRIAHVESGVKRKQLFLQSIAPNSSFSVVKKCINISSKRSNSTIFLDMSVKIEQKGVNVSQSCSGRLAPFLRLVNGLNQSVESL